MEGLNLVNSSRKNKRRELDYYSTPPDVTQALMRFLKLSPCYKIWEPACGDGAMSKELEKFGNTVISTDIRKTGYGIADVDFLKTKKECNAIITNPPFKLSEQFIRHAVPQARTVAMLLKSQYWHAKKRTQLFRDYPPAYILALNWRPDFMGGERGGSPTMEVHWTVWIFGQRNTRYRILTRKGDGPEYGSDITARAAE